MRIINVLLIFLLCSGCGQLAPKDVPTAMTMGAKAIVFDIDGTLTPDVNSVFQARPDAAKAVRIYADKGYTIIYLSTRISQLQAGIPDWLKSNGFPEGNIHVAQTNEDHNNPDIYKLRMLREYVTKGWNIVLAFGDSTTDFKAYAGADIPRDHVFALLRESKSKCEPGDWVECLSGWTEHLDFATKAPTAKGT